MARIDHPIHERLVEHLDIRADGTLLDLGCGEGGHLVAAAQRWPRARLVGLDRRRPAGLAAGSLVLADLDDPLPIRSGTVDAIVSHNLLECLADPMALLAEAARVLRPGGTAVWSHTDFDAIVIDSGEPELDRRIAHAYADHPQVWMDHADGRMGRKLAGLVNRSPLSLVSVDSHVTIATSLIGDAAVRVDEIASALDGVVPEVAHWRDGVGRADREGRFFFAETAFIVTATRA